MLDPMFCARRLACVALATAASGCLAAPPPEANGLDGCQPFVENDFDNGSIWSDYVEPGATVARAPDEVYISVAPTSEALKAYADLHSESMLPVAATDLAAALVIDGEGYPVGGISWTYDIAEGPEDDDYYDLIIDSGYLHAVRKRAFEDRVVLCSPECPEYDPVRHARLRLRAAGALVYFQASEDGIEWRDIARAVHSVMA